MKYIWWCRYLKNWPGCKIYYGILGLTSSARNSQKKQYLIFGEMWKKFSFAYLSAVWLQFGQNPVEKTCLQWFQLDFAQIVTKQLIDKQN